MRRAVVFLLIVVSACAFRPCSLHSYSRLRAVSNRPLALTQTHPEGVLKPAALVLSRTSLLQSRPLLLLWSVSIAAMLAFALKFSWASRLRNPRAWFWNSKQASQMRASSGKRVKRGWTPGDSIVTDLGEVRAIKSSPPVRLSQEAVTLTEVDRKKISEQLAFFKPATGSAASAAPASAPAPAPAPAPDPVATMPEIKNAMDLDSSDVVLASSSSTNEPQQSTESTFSLKSVRGEFKRRNAKSYAIIRRMDNQNIPVATGVSVSLLVLSLVKTFALALPLGIIASIVSKRAKGETADNLRAIGGKAIDLANWVVGVDAKYQMTDKVVDTIVEGVELTLGPETTQSLEPLWKAYEALSKTVVENQELGDEAINSIVSTAESALDALEEANTKYSLLETGGNMATSAIQLAFNAVQAAAVAVQAQVEARVQARDAPPQPFTPPARVSSNNTPRSASILNQEKKVSFTRPRVGKKKSV